MGALEGLVVLLLLVLVVAGFMWATRRAKRGGEGIHVVGAVLMLMGFGNMRDPTNETVQVAKQTRRRDSGDSGDDLD